MSCATLSTQAINLNVAMGNLPEGFCPSTLQELGQAIAARLIITPSQNFNSFATGSVAPSANVGPWFKDCQEWFFFDDATASYRPVVLRGTLTNEQYFLTSGSFVVPDFVYKIRIHAWGGGGGGSAQGAAQGPSGGGGSYGRLTATVTPGQVISYTIGTGGAKGAAGANGGSTVILTMTCGGGFGGAVSVGTSQGQGAGGTATGADFSINGTSGSTTTTNAGGNGGAAGGGGGGGGTSSNTELTLNGIVPGGGGAGGTSGGPTTLGGNGAAGAIIIQY